MEELNIIIVCRKYTCNQLVNKGKLRIYIYIIEKIVTGAKQPILITVYNNGQKAYRYCICVWYLLSTLSCI